MPRWQAHNIDLFIMGAIHHLSSLQFGETFSISGYPVPYIYIGIPSCSPSDSGSRKKEGLIVPSTHVLAQLGGRSMEYAIFPQMQYHPFGAFHWILVLIFSHACRKWEKLDRGLCLGSERLEYDHY